MRLASIHTYPVKGCRRIDRAEAVVEPWGLAGDRRWLVVEPDGKFLTQRRVPALALIRPSENDGTLVLTADGPRRPHVPHPDAPT
jgi:uncharacterized protein YcbX